MADINLELIDSCVKFPSDSFEQLHNRKELIFSIMEKQLIDIFMGDIGNHQRDYTSAPYKATDTFNALIKNKGTPDIIEMFSEINEVSRNKEKRMEMKQARLSPKKNLQHH